MLELNHVLFLVGGTLRYTPLDIWQHLSYPLLLNFIPSFLITFPFLKYCHPLFLDTQSVPWHWSCPSVSPAVSPAVSHKDSFTSSQLSSKGFSKGCKFCGGTSFQYFPSRLRQFCGGDSVVGGHLIFGYMWEGDTQLLLGGNENKEK